MRLFAVVLGSREEIVKTKAPFPKRWVCRTVRVFHFQQFRPCHL